MGNIESVDGQSEMKQHIMPLKVPMPDPTELEEKFAIVLVSLRANNRTFATVRSNNRVVAVCVLLLNLSVVGLFSLKALDHSYKQPI